MVVGEDDRDGGLRGHAQQDVPRCGKPATREGKTRALSGRNRVSHGAAGGRWSGMTISAVPPSAPSDRAEGLETGATTPAAERERRLLRRVHPTATCAARRPTGRGHASARAGACPALCRPRRAARRSRPGRLHRRHEVDRRLRTSRRPVRLASYATPTVLGEIKRHFRDKTWLLRVPRPMKERQVRVAQARDRLTHRLGRAPAVHEIAATLGASSRDVVAAIETAWGAPRAVIPRARGRQRDPRGCPRCRGPRDRARRDPRAARQRLRRALPARTGHPPPALRRGFLAGRDRSADRPEPNAGVAPHRPVARARAAAARAQVDRGALRRSPERERATAA